jgi:hypothetical protein
MTDPGIINPTDIRRFIALRYNGKFNEDYFEELVPLLGTGKNTKSQQRIPEKDAVRVRTEIKDFLSVLGVKDDYDLQTLFTSIDTLGGFSNKQKTIFKYFNDANDKDFTDKFSTFLRNGFYKVVEKDKAKLESAISDTIKNLNGKGLDLGKSLLDQKLPKKYKFLKDDVKVGGGKQETQTDAGEEKTQTDAGEDEDEDEDEFQDTEQGGEEKADINEKGKVKTEAEKIESSGKAKPVAPEQPKLRGSGRKLTPEQQEAFSKSQQEKAKQQEATKKGEGAGAIAEGVTQTQETAPASLDKEELAQQEQADRELAEELQTEELRTPRETEAQAEAQQPPNVTTEISKQDQPPEGKENRINIGQQVDDIPKETKLSKIDESRFSTQFKTIAQLNEDIKYFISNFGNVLGKTLIEEYNKINKQNLAQVRRLHGKMSGVLQTDKKKEVKIGIIIDADEYIREKINMVIAQNATSGLKASGLIINVEGEPTKEGDKSIGNFDVRKARLGGSLAYQREPVYRFIPKSNPQNVDLEERKKPSGRGIQMLGTKRIDLVSTATRQRANDPFAKSRNTIKLKYIY